MASGIRIRADKPNYRYRHVFEFRIWLLLLVNTNNDNTRISSCNRAIISALQNNRFRVIYYSFRWCVIHVILYEKCSRTHAHLNSHSICNFPTPSFTYPAILLLLNPRISPFACQLSSKCLLIRTVRVIKFYCLSFFIPPLLYLFISSLGFR